jgi:DNA (cytosine-5)-methyltransferase 1
MRKGEAAKFAWYNEIDPQKAAWLRELIKAGVIAPGEVDERPIQDVRADDLRGFVQCHFFADIGVWSYAFRLAGWPDDREVWTGSCPCPSFSSAGKGEGFSDPRHLWPDWFRLISERRPATIFGEQVSAAIRHGWLDLVQTSLEAQDYAVGKAILTSASVGGADIRERLYFVAHATAEGLSQRTGQESGSGRQKQEFERLGATGILGDFVSTRLEGHSGHGADSNEPGWLGADEARPAPANGVLGGFWANAEWIPCRNPKVPGAIDWRPIKSGSFVLASRTINRVLKLRGFGDAINAQVARTWIEVCQEAMSDYLVENGKVKL